MSRNEQQNLKTNFFRARRKNAVIVLKDADLDKAAEGIVKSAFTTTGQRCTAASRVIVDRSVKEELLKK
ncbi:aldehyde dehydrogenase family protein [Priestia megaterium]